MKRTCSCVELRKDENNEYINAYNLTCKGIRALREISNKHHRLIEECYLKLYENSSCIEYFEYCKLMIEHYNMIIAFTNRRIYDQKLKYEQLIQALEKDKKLKKRRMV
jgi:hypothetical protein